MSIYALCSLGEPDNQIIFNDYTSEPVFRVLARMPQKYQVRAQDLPIPFQSGISDFLTLIGDTLYVIQGIMYPSSEANYDSGLLALRSVASLDIEQADIYSDNGYVPFKMSDSAGNYSKQIFVKALYALLPETTRQGLKQPFTIICRIKDPTIFGGTLKTASTQQANPVASTGSAIYPFTYPVVYGASVYTTSADASNLGTLAAYPQEITVYGPVNNPKVTNSVTGEFIQVTENLGPGDKLVIQYSKDSRSVTLNGINVANQVTSDSTFWKIQPGTQTIQLSGSSVSTGAYTTVSYYDTWPLS